MHSSSSFYDSSDVMIDLTRRQEADVQLTRFGLYEIEELVKSYGKRLRFLHSRPRIRNVDT